MDVGIQMIWKKPTVEYVNITWDIRKSTYDLQGPPERMQWILSKSNGVSSFMLQLTFKEM